MPRKACKVFFCLPRVYEFVFAAAVDSAVVAAAWHEAHSLHERAFIIIDISGICKTLVLVRCCISVLGPQGLTLRCAFAFSTANCIFISLILEVIIRYKVSVSKPLAVTGFIMLSRCHPLKDVLGLELPCIWGILKWAIAPTPIVAYDHRWVIWNSIILDHVFTFIFAIILKIQTRFMNHLLLNRYLPQPHFV